MEEASKARPQQSLNTTLLDNDAEQVQRTNKQRKRVERLEGRLGRKQAALREIETAQPLVPVEPWFAHSRAEMADELRTDIGKLQIRLEDERARLRELAAASPAA